MSKTRIPDGFLDELKARLKPSDVIGRKVKLTRRGKDWVGLSPFTNEKTPSFYVNDDKGFFKDFSSGLGGDVIKFLMETERLDFMEVVERLASEAGMELPKDSAEAEARYDRALRLKQACRDAASFFQECLHRPDAMEARTYLAEKRGLKDSAWARWGIGYAPDDWRALRTKLLRDGYTDAELLAAGLIKTSEKGGEPYDVFRNRIMFPIEDARGDVIAFGGRALDPDDKAKYLNSPETDLFHKSRVLYNYKRAREALGYGERGGLIVCEGYMDVIALGEAGHGNAVAPLGTALTPDQLGAIWKAGPDPIMCFDGDGAGLRAAYKAIDTALPHVLPDRSVYFCLLPDGLDPDDLLRQSGGAGRMKDLLENALPMIEMLWQRESAAEPLDTPERKAGLEDRLKSAAAKIEHAGVRAAYERDLLSRMREHFWQMRRTRRSGQASGDFAANTVLKVNGGPPRALGSLVRAASSPELVDAHLELLARADFCHPIANDICDAIFEAIKAGEVSRAAVSATLEAAHNTVARAHFDAYPPVSPIQRGSAAAEEWCLIIEAYFVEADEDVASSPGERESFYASGDNLAALSRQVAERHRLRSEASEAQMAAYEAQKTRR